MFMYIAIDLSLFAVSKFFSFFSLRAALTSVINLRATNWGRTVNTYTAPEVPVCQSSYANILLFQLICVIQVSGCHAP